MALLWSGHNQMKLSNHLIITGGLVCCLLSNIGTVTAFLLINPSSIGKTIITTRDSYHSSQLFSTPTENNNNRRRQFLVSSIIAAPILIGRGAAWADEPTNIYYKSKSDEEDQFGRSLSQSMTTTVTDDDNDDGSNNNKGGRDGSKKELQQSSFSPPPQADLTKALQEKSQQRRIDPRTHG